jgi:magnesium transporter
MKLKLNTLEETLDDFHKCINGFIGTHSRAIDIASLQEYFRDWVRQIEYAQRRAERLGGEINAIHESYQLKAQDRTNRRLGVLTVISVVFMPLTLLAGIYGMNFWYMPELAWKYAYPVVLISMAAISTALLVYFIRKGWFSGR